MCGGDQPISAAEPASTRTWRGRALLPIVAAPATAFRRTGADDGLLHDRPRRAQTIGRPLVSAAFLLEVDAMLGRPIALGMRAKVEPVNGDRNEIHCHRNIVNCNLTATVHIDW